MVAETTLSARENEEVRAILKDAPSAGAQESSPWAQVVAGGAVSSIKPVAQPWARIVGVNEADSTHLTRAAAPAERFPALPSPPTPPVAPTPRNHQCPQPPSDCQVIKPATRPQHAKELYEVREDFVSRRCPRGLEPSPTKTPLLPPFSPAPMHCNLFSRSRPFELRSAKLLATIDKCLFDFVRRTTEASRQVDLAACALLPRIQQEARRTLAFINTATACLHAALSATLATPAAGDPAVARGDDQLLRLARRRAGLRLVRCRLGRARRGGGCQEGPPTTGGAARPRLPGAGPGARQPRGPSRGPAPRAPSGGPRRTRLDRQRLKALAALPALQACPTSTGSTPRARTRRSCARSTCSRRGWARYPARARPRSSARACPSPRSPSSRPPTRRPIPPSCTSTCRCTRRSTRGSWRSRTCTSFTTRSPCSGARPPAPARAPTSRACAHRRLSP